VTGDPTQLYQVLLNLCVNARDAMLQGGRLTIETSNAFLDERYARAHAEVLAGQYVLISVTDTGAGMSPEVILRAFDPFYTTKEVGRGTGLGLSQVFGFVKQSGGHVKIYSEIGDGTSVKIYLPRWAGSEDAPTSQSQTETLATPRALEAEVILAVEDDASVRQVTSNLLRELGYTVVAAASGNEALALLPSLPRIDALVTDIVMPGMNGRALAEKMLVERPTIKVLYVTGYTRNAVVHNGILDPGVAFLPKPFTTAQLGQKLRQVLDS
jgi:CheY-like chemotaxis protein